MKTSACRDGTVKNQPNKMGTTPQHIHTIPTSCAILPTVCLLVVCRRGLSCTWKGVAWVCSACVVVHSAWVVLYVLLMVAMHFVAAECGRYGPSCVQKLWSG